MTKKLTYYERSRAKRMQDPAYRAEYTRARLQIAFIDTLVNALDDRREALGISKSELARRIDKNPAMLRRLFSAESPNPTLLTVAELLTELGATVEIRFDDTSIVLGENAKPKRRAPRKQAKPVPA